MLRALMCLIVFLSFWFGIVLPLFISSKFFCFTDWIFFWITEYFMNRAEPREDRAEPSSSAPCRRSFRALPGPSKISGLESSFVGRSCESAGESLGTAALVWLSFFLHFLLFFLFILQKYLQNV